jgi:hypothetical protein
MPMKTALRPCRVCSLSAKAHAVGRVAEWFKAAVLKTARGFTLPRGFESHPFRHHATYPIGITWFSYGPCPKPHINPLKAC